MNPWSVGVLALSLAACSGAKIRPVSDLAFPAKDLDVEIDSKSVAAVQERSCMAYFFVPEGAEMPMPFIISMRGSGMHTTSNGGTLSLAEREILRSGKAAVLTIDKPGIVADPKSDQPNGVDRFKVDIETYKKHTTEDLVLCAVSALGWIGRDYRAVLTPEIILSGHGEGAYLISLIYKQLLIDDHPLVKKIKKVILSGVPLLAQTPAVHRKIDGKYPEGVAPKMRKRFHDAVKKGDDGFLVGLTGSASAFWKHEFKAKTPREVFQDLIRFKAEADFYFFQGNKDKETPAQLMRDFEARNKRKRRNYRPALRIKVHYYNAMHQVDRPAFKDMLDAYGL